MRSPKTPFSLLVATAALVFGCTRSAPDHAAATNAPVGVEQGASVAKNDVEHDAPVATNDGENADRKLRIFVSNYQADTISVVEGDPGMEVRTIPGGESPHGLALRPSKPHLLAVANSTGNGVTFVDADTLEEKGVVQTSRGPQDLVFSSDGKSLFVISPLAFDLQVVDVDTMKVVGEPIRFEKKPRRILLDASGDRLFVLLISLAKGGQGAEVAVLDAKTREVLKRIPVGRQPDGMALGNRGRTLASASFDDSSITVIDTASLEVVATYPARTGMGLAIHPDKPIAYSSESFDDNIQVLDLETGKEITTISAGAWPTYSSFGPDGRYLYVPHEESDSVVVIDTDTNKVVAKIAVGREPIELAVYRPD